MSDLTYEAKDRSTKYETYEWDNTWLVRADKPEAARILYIGDSISIGIRRSFTAQVEGKVEFDQFATSRGLDNPFYCDVLTPFIKQESRRDAVFFNNGLHGWHLNDDSEYGEYYENMLSYLKRMIPDTPIIPVLTTRLKDEQRNERVRARNKTVCEIAERLGLPVVDLYSVSEKNAVLLDADGVHFKPEGYTVLAAEVIASLKKSVPGIF